MNTPQISATRPLRVSLRGARGSEGLLCDTGAQTNNGDHKNQDDE
jgi:hypothetical protein